MTIKPITWKAEPMGHRAKAFSIVAHNHKTGKTSRRFYGHTLQDTLGKSGLLGIIQYDTRRMAEEVSS